MCSNPPQVKLYQQSVFCIFQRVYSLLPPTYRDCWLEWQEAEDAKKAASKVEENKPRDQYLAKLMKKLKVEEKVESDSPAMDSSPAEDEEEDEELGDTWEDLASDEVDSKFWSVECWKH